MDNESQSARDWFSVWLMLLLLATLAINLLSAFIRHQEAGLGCEPWPACFAEVEALIEPPGDSPAAALTPADTAKQAHRTIATGLVVLVLIVVFQARQKDLRGFDRFLPHTLIAVILALSVIGPASYLKTLPAVATANLIGGMGLLGIVWWLKLACGNPAVGNTALARGPVTAALIVLAVQIILGAWVSANFAGTSCSALFSCAARAGEQESGQGLASFWYFRELTLTETGHIQLGSAQALIQQVHHAGAMVCTLVLSALAALTLREPGTVRRWGIVLLAAVGLQVLLGLAMLAFGLPLIVVVLHNLTASLVLLCVLRLVRLSWQPVAAGSQ